jgi:hypothetical protein
VRGDQWIIVRNWDKFQHYKNRRPVWIKLYTELTSDSDWLGLSDAQRGLLATIWIEYACAKRRLRVRDIVRMEQAADALRTPNRTPEATRKSVGRALVRLNQAGFIIISASPEVEKEKERSLNKNYPAKDLVENIMQRLPTMPA